MNHPGRRTAEHHELQQLHNHSRIGVMAIEETGIITYANPVALNYSGRQKEEILFRPFSSVFQDAEPDLKNQESLLQLKEITNKQFILNKQVGRYRTMGFNKFRGSAR